MPLFGFQCSDCGKTSEVLVRGEEQPTCVHCGSKKLEKQMSHFAPMNGPAGEPAGCGNQSCCQMQNGSCPYSG